MHRGPALEPVAYKCGDAFFTCDADQALHKAVITVVVDRWRKPQHRGANPACLQRKRRLLRLAGGIGIGRILFCCERTLTLSGPDRGSDDERTIRAHERAAESLDSEPILLCGASVVQEID